MKILALTMLLLFIVGCKKTEPVITQEPTPTPTIAITPEEVGVIERITVNQSEEPATELDKEVPQKPEEAIVNTTQVAIITIKDLKFIPKELNVSFGTTIVWQHRDQYAGKDFIKHVLTIYPPNGAGFTSPPMLFGDDYKATLTENGTYRYISVPFKNRMTGYINVG